jgi:hypothetical protein
MFYNLMQWWCSTVVKTKEGRGEEANEEWGEKGGNEGKVEIFSVGEIAWRQYDGCD